MQPDAKSDEVKQRYEETVVTLRTTRANGCINAEVIQSFSGA
jgi:hypothetical protein